MNRIKYAEQLYALISMCLGCAFIVFGLLSFIGILQPTSADRARDPDRIKILEHRYPLVAFLHIEFVQELVGDDGGVDALFQMCIAEV